MRKLPPPEITNTEVIKACISNIEDATLNSNVLGNLSTFNRAIDTYVTNGANRTLETITSHTDINGVISKDQMKFLYGKMVIKKNKSARDYYDILLHSAKKCPFCGYGVTSTLDHLLPKSQFPIYAVAPINLVPSCKDCNTTKLAMTTQDNIIFMHPYFDNVDDERWLFCEVGYFEDTVVFRFTVIKPLSWSELKFKRMEYHFKSFNLNNLFIGFASDEFSDSLYGFKKLLDTKGSVEVKNDLDSKFESCESNLINHWKTAMYDTLRNDELFYIEWLKQYQE